MENLITAIIEKTPSGFTGYFKEVDGVISAGESIEEVRDNLKEAYEHYLDYLNETQGSKLSIDDVEINYTIDLEQFFEYFDVINKTKFAEKIGMNPSLFRQYTKGIANLSENKLLEITKGLRNLAADLESFSLV